MGDRLPEEVNRRLNVNQLLFYDFCRWTAGPFFSMAMGLRCEGAENIPEEGGALIVGNHRQPVLDPFCIGVKVERPINWAGVSWPLKIPILGSLWRGWGIVPLEITGDKKNVESLNLLVELLKDGELVGLFPEGAGAVANLHKVSRVATFKTGFARLALEARVPIIPVAIIARWEKHLPNIPPRLTRLFLDLPEFEKGHPVSIYRKALVRIGRPIDLGELYEREVDRELINYISGKVRRVVMKLYNREDDDRFMTGEKPFDIACDRV